MIDKVKIKRGMYVVYDDGELYKVLDEESGFLRVQNITAIYKGNHTLSTVLDIYFRPFWIQRNDVFNSVSGVEVTIHEILNSQELILKLSNGTLHPITMEAFLTSIK